MDTPFSKHQDARDSKDNAKKWQEVFSNNFHWWIRGVIVFGIFAHSYLSGGALAIENQWQMIRLRDPNGDKFCKTVAPPNMESTMHVKCPWSKLINFQENIGIHQWKLFTLNVTTIQRNWLVQRHLILS